MPGAAHLTRRPPILIQYDASQLAQPPPSHAQSSSFTFLLATSILCNLLSKPLRIWAGWKQRTALHYPVPKSARDFRYNSMASSQLLNSELSKKNIFAIAGITMHPCTASHLPFSSPKLSPLNKHVTDLNSRLHSCHNGKTATPYLLCCYGRKAVMITLN